MNAYKKSNIYLKFSDIGLKQEEFIITKDIVKFQWKNDIVVDFELPIGTEFSDIKSLEFFSQEKQSEEFDFTPKVHFFKKTEKSFITNKPKTEIVQKLIRGKALDEIAENIQDCYSPDKVFEIKKPKIPPLLNLSTGKDKKNLAEIKVAFNYFKNSKTNKNNILLFVRINIVLGMRKNLYHFDFNLGQGLKIILK